MAHHATNNVMWVLIAGVATLVLAHTAPFPFLVDRFAPSRSLWHMPRDTAPPVVYLTFDDGPNPTATPDLLDVLRDANARATFFLIDGHLTPATAPIVRRMFAEGHAVALHSNQRALMIKTPTALAGTITQQRERIRQLAGGDPCRLFRPHGGWRSTAMLAGLERVDHRLVGWSFGLWDFNWYRRPQAAALAQRLARRASAGDIVVMHDGHHKNPRADRRYTVDATRELVPALRARGFELGTLCESANKEASEGTEVTEGTDSHGGTEKRRRTESRSILVGVPSTPTAVITAGRLSGGPIERPRGLRCCGSLSSSSLLIPTPEVIASLHSRSGGSVRSSRLLWFGKTLSSFTAATRSHGLFVVKNG